MLQFEPYQQCRFSSRSLAANGRCSRCGQPAKWMYRHGRCQRQARCDECKKVSETSLIPRGQPCL